jgi:hypothetical protein
LRVHTFVLPDRVIAVRAVFWLFYTMLYPLVGYVTKDDSGTSWAHITYVGLDSCLHDLVRKAGSNTWIYNCNITASANALIDAANSGPVNTGWQSVPTVGKLPFVGVAVISPGNSAATLPVLIYYAADNNIHALYQVGQGYYWPGEPGVPDGSSDGPDGDDYDGDPNFGDGLELGGGGSIYSPPSPNGWADVIVAETLGQPPLAVYSTPGASLEQSVTVIYVAGGAYAVNALDPSQWSQPINVSTLTETAVKNASGVYWPQDGTEHVFCPNISGLLDEFWAKTQAHQTQWGAHDVLHQVKALAPLPPGETQAGQLAPKLMVGSQCPSFIDANGSKNVAYIDQVGEVHLCTHGLHGSWSIANLTLSSLVYRTGAGGVRTAEPGFVGGSGVSSPPCLIAWSSGWTHVAYVDSQGKINDLSSGLDGSWYWSGPSFSVPGVNSGVDAFVMAMSAFSWAEDGTDHIVCYLDNDNIVDLVLKHGSAPLEGPGTAGLPWSHVNVTAQVQSSPGYVPFTFFDPSIFEAL